MKYRVDIQPVCKLRHENGNCLPVGGCCPAVPKEICDALQGAYETGFHDCLLWKAQLELESVKNGVKFYCGKD